MEGIVSTFKGWANVQRNPHNSRICPYCSPSIRTRPLEEHGRGVSCQSSLSFSLSIALTSFSSIPCTSILPSTSPSFPCNSTAEEVGLPAKFLVECMGLGSLPERRVLQTSSLSHMISTRSLASSFLLRIDLDRLSRDDFTTLRDKRRKINGKISMEKIN